MMLNATFDNISVISWRSVFFWWSTWRKPPTCRKSLTTLSHTVVSSTPRHGLDSEVKTVYIAFVIFNYKFDYLL